MASLQDQLLKAGIVDEKKAKQAAKDKRKQAKQAKNAPKGQRPVDESKQQAKKALAEKAARDRELNQQQQAIATEKAIAAQIKQLIQVNRIARDDSGEIAYKFTDGKKIKNLYVNEILQTQLIKGRIAIVALDGNYELVPAAVAEKINERDAQRVLVLNSNASSDDDLAEDDPYADYKIPDDLMW